MKSIIRIIAIMIITMLFASMAVAQEVTLIVNKANPANTITAAKVSQVYSGRMTRWDSGTKIVPSDQKPGNAATTQFLSKYVQKSASEYQSMWMSKMLSGEGSAPKVHGSDTEVINFVQNNEGAVGYVDKGSVTDAVKVLQVQ